MTCDQNTDGDSRGHRAHCGEREARAQSRAGRGLVQGEAEGAGGHQQGLSLHPGGLFALWEDASVGGPLPWQRLVPEQCPACAAAQGGLSGLVWGAAAGTRARVGGLAGLQEPLAAGPAPPAGSPLLSAWPTAPPQGGGLRPVCPPSPCSSTICQRGRKSPVTGPTSVASAGNRKPGASGYLPTCLSLLLPGGVGDAGGEA